MGFPGQTVHFGLYHVLHILKAFVLADNLSYQKKSFEYPMRRQIFANTVGRICKLNLTLRLMPFHAHDAHWMQRETLIEWVSCRLIWASSPITVISPHSALATHSFAQCFDDGDLIKGIVKGTVRRSSLCGFWFCCSNEVVTSHFLAKGRLKNGHFPVRLTVSVYPSPPFWVCFSS